MQEMCRRFLADEADFSPEKLQEAGITKTFVNNDLEHTEQADHFLCEILYDRIHNEVTVWI